MTYYVITSANSINYTTSSTLYSARDIGAGDSLLVTNTGYILATGAQTTGVYVNAYASNSVVTVDGLVSATGVGIHSLAQNARFVISGHVIGSEGMRVSNNGLVTITETGVVSNGMSLSGQMVNNGEINSNAGWGVQFSSGFITNNGLISSTGDAIFFGGEGVIRLINNGTIAGSFSTWYGATSTAAYATIENRGDWLGDLSLAPGADTVTNSGLIAGDVSLGKGNDILDSRYGTITGTINGGEGNDTIRAGAGDDIIEGGAGADVINGGGGHNGVVYQSSTVGVTVNLANGVAKYGHAAGDKLTDIQDITGTFAKDRLVGNDEDNTLNGILGKDTLNGNGGNDTFLMYGGGNAVINGGTGDDYIQMITVSVPAYGYAFTAKNKIDGGDGYDTLDLTNAGTVVFNNSTVVNVERIVLQDGYDYGLKTVDATIGKGKLLEIDASTLASGFKLQFDGSAEKDGKFQIDGGSGADVLIAGAKNDVIAGNGGADILTGGGGADIFVYSAATDSLFAAHDSITDFKAGTDKFMFDFDVAAVDATVAASVSSALDLEGLLGGLAANHAVLVKVNGGSLNGRTLLVVDADGVAGYDDATDFVIDVKLAGSLSAGDFLS